MPQVSSPTRTAISEVVADDGQDPRHMAEHQRGIPGGTSRPAPPVTDAAPALAICGW